MSTCTRCGATLAPDARFCSACGAAAPPPETSSRRRVTALFCDLVGSTAMAERVDAEVVHGIMSRYGAEMAAVIGRHGGRVEKFIGDAVMAVFGIPHLHEDDALRAVRAADEMRTSLARLNGELEAKWGVRLQTRTGVATGEVVASGGAGPLPVVGSMVNLAARLEQAADPGVILIDRETHRLVRFSVEASPVDDLHLKGFDDGIGAFALGSVERGSAEARRAEPPFVDRISELGLLRALLDDAAATRRCRVVTIEGDAGIGKSRLVRELLADARDRVRVLVGRCPAYGQGPSIRPVAEAIAASLEERDGGGSAVGSAVAGLLAGREDGDAIADAIGSLLEPGGTASPPEEAFRAVRSVLEALARERPVVLVLDDVHWADSTFLELVRHVAEWSRDAPILVVCLARPELAEAHPRWGRSPGDVSLRLEPLPADDGRALARHLLPSGAARLDGAIAAAADGNPFFLEEIVASLVEQPAPIPDDPAAIAIPPTISAVLAARIDRLDGAERSVVERMAVLGTDADERTIAALGDDEAVAVAPVARVLIERDLLASTERPGSFRFRHDLTREAAYAGIPKARRADLHERAAEAIEASDTDPAAHEAVGHHLEEARRFVVELGVGGAARAEALGRRAADHLAAAGRGAAARGDVRAAAGLLARAAAPLPARSSQRLEVLADLHDAALAAGDLDVAGEAVASLLEELGEATGPLAERARMQDALLRFLLDPRAVPRDELRATLDRAIEAFAAVDDERDLAAAYGARAVVAWLEGDAAAMAEDAERAFRLARASGNRRAMTDAAATLAISLVHGPTPLADADERLRALIAELEGDRLSQAAIRLDLAVSLALRGRTDDARREADRARDVLEDLGQRRWLVRATQVLAEIAKEDGDLAEAIERHRSVHASFAEQGDAVNATPSALALADALLDAGRIDEADALAAEAEREAAEDDLEAQVAWRSIRAVAAARRGNAAFAEELAREAAARAAASDFVLMRAETSETLAEVLSLAGRDGEARAAAAEAAEGYRRKGASAALERILAVGG